MRASRKRQRRASGMNHGCLPVPSMNNSPPREVLLADFARPRDRPGPDARRQAQDRAAMRHVAEAEAALAVGVDRGGLRQGPVVGHRDATQRTGYWRS